MRQLVLHPVECRLTNELRNRDLGRLLVDVSIGVQHRPFGEQVDQFLDEQVHLMTLHRRDGDDLRPRDAHLDAELGDLDQPLREYFTRDRIHFGHNGDDGLSAKEGELRGNESVSRTNFLIGRDAHADNVDVGPGFANLIVEPFAEKGARTMQTRCVDQHKLAFGSIDHAAQHTTRGLRTVGGDRDFAPDHRVGQG